jgi:hypothetical protein
MCRKIISTVIAILTVNLVCSSEAFAQTRTLTADEAKVQISRLGTGPKVVVRVTLKDKRKMQGWLSLTADDHFSLTEEKTGNVTDVNYADVAAIKNLKPSKGLIAIGAVVGIGTAAAIFFFAGAKH